MSAQDRRQWIEAALAQYECRLLRYARRLVGEERALDVVQETFLKLCRDDLPPINGSLGPWLYTVCRNLAFDLLRKESRMPATLEHEAPATATSEPHEQTELRDSTQQVLHELHQLTTNQQECLRLKFEGGLTYREIADITGLSVSNVGFTIHTAIQKLRQKLQASGDEGLGSRD